MQRLSLACQFTLVIILAYTPAVLARPDAIEIGPNNVADLPGGREADGIIGDFVLRNDRIEVVVSGNQHQRRANMVMYYDAPTPGCIYDLTLRGENNDQLTLLAPNQQKGGPLSHVVILKDGSDGEAIVRAELTAAAGAGLGRRHDYILRDSWRYVVIVSTYENRTAAAAKVKTQPRWEGLTFGFSTQEVATGLCQDPDDRLGYAFAALPHWPGADKPTDEVELAPGGKAIFAHTLAVGCGTAEAFGILKSIDAADAPLFEGQVVDAQGKPVLDAAINITIPDAKDALVNYVDREGRYRFQMPKPTRDAVIKSAGRSDLKTPLNADTQQTLTMEAMSGVEVTVTDAERKPLPCKVQFIGIDGTETPYLGPTVRAHGCDNQYQSEDGHFTQGLPPGKYRLVITHGIEFAHAEATIEVAPGKITPVAAQIQRVIDSTGWVSADFHNHTTQSGDNYCGVDDRIINLAAEQVEFAPATEHNRIYDWRPHIERLGLAPLLNTTTGMELTGRGPHLNSFPLQPEPYRQDLGGPEWNPDPRVNALVLRHMPGDPKSRWVQLNHPTLSQYFRDLDSDGKDDGGFPGLAQYIDGTEVYGEHILAGTSDCDRKINGKTYKRENWPFGWMQMMSAGQRVWTVCTSDAHEVTRGGVGGWRMYVPSKTDDPAKIDAKEVIAQAKAGHSFVTNGPFIEVRTADGHGPGDTFVSVGPVTLKVRVQCNTWTDINRVAVLVNGRIGEGLDFTKEDHPEMFSHGFIRFERDITVPIKADAFLIVVAEGRGLNLETGYGRSWQAGMHPAGYHNPIFVDVDGNGFTPNGDMLGQDYLKDIGRGR